ncbi:MAG TPA: SGNH hydrolase domain-containing protein, partial [Acidimicrobiia bacterium]|nr:SGNH hydrolase domain-containing protein [Acidimicrobiia bacterium]
SYAIYLWHWPLVILAEARWGDLPVWTLAALGAGSVLLAWLTKHLVEDPIRFQKSLAAAPWRSLLAGGTTMAVLSTLALTGWVTRPTLVDEPPESADPGLVGAAALVSDRDASDWEVRGDPETVYTPSGPLVPDPTLATDDVPAYYADDCQIGVGDAEPDDRCVYGQIDADAELVLWGDSKLGQYFTPFDAIAEREGWRLTTYLKSACPPTVAGALEDECSEFGTNVVERILGQQTPPVAVIISTFTPSTEPLKEGSREAIGALTSAGIPVIVLADNPGPIIPDDAPYKTIYDCAAERPDDLASCSFDHREANGTELLQGLAEAYDLPVVDLNPWVCPPSGQACPVAIGGELVYRQGSHLTDTYARSLSPVLHRELLAVGVGETDPRSISLTDVPPRSSE